MPGKKKKKPTLLGRLNLLIDPELKQWAHEYARRMHTTVTQLIIDYFVALRKEERSDGVEQL